MNNNNSKADPAREAQYAEACEHRRVVRIVPDAIWACEDCGLAFVADEEQAELRAEVEDEHANHMTYFRKWQRESRRADALVADLRGLADSWDPPVTTQLLQEGFGWDEDMSALADDIRAVLDKHAGEQPRSRTDSNEAKRQALQAECDRQWLDSLGPDPKRIEAARRALDKHAGEQAQEGDDR